MTKLEVKRFEYGTNYTIGHFYIDGVYQCFTLEDKVREVEGQPVSQWKIANQTAIPRGTYKVVNDFSPHFNGIRPHILDVPGYEGVRIHSGNTDKDTEGCILLGKDWAGTDFIGSSSVAFLQVFDQIKDATDMTITIS